MLTLRKSHLAIAILLVLMLFMYSGATLQPTQASLGNRGVPVRCWTPAEIEPGTTQTSPLTCTSADGTWVSDSPVPDGYYFLITDIFVNVWGAGSSADGVTDVRIDRMSNGTVPEFELRLRGTTTDTFGRSFITPYIVLEAGEWLRVQGTATNPYGIYVQASGLLVTNVSYMPMVAR